MKSQIKKTTEVTTYGLLIPTFIKLKQKVVINPYFSYWKGKIMNNHKKIASLAT